MIPEWIYRNLDDFGNCLAPESVIKQIGDKRFLNELWEHGYQVEFQTRKVDEFEGMQMPIGRPRHRYRTTRVLILVRRFK